MDKGVAAFEVKVEFVKDGRRENAGVNSTPKTKGDAAKNAEDAADGDDVDSLHGAFRSTGSDVFKGKAGPNGTRVEDAIEACGYGSRFIVNFR